MTNREAALATVTRLLDELAIIEGKVEVESENVATWRVQLGIWKADGVRALEKDYSPQAAELLRASHGRGDPDLVKVIRSEIRRYEEVCVGLRDHIQDYGAGIKRLPHPEVRKRREKVRKLWISGLTDSQIAWRLVVGESTVKRDRKALGLRA